MDIDERLEQVEKTLDDASGILERMVNDPELKHMFQPPEVEIETDTEQ